MKRAIVFLTIGISIGAATRWIFPSKSKILVNWNATSEETKEAEKKYFQNLEKRLRDPSIQIAELKDTTISGDAFNQWTATNYHKSLVVTGCKIGDFH